MELSQEFLIDMAINAGGYLLAGIISILFYAMFQKKKSPYKVDEVVEELTISDLPVESNVNTESISDRTLEFINFGSSQQQSRIEQKEVKIEEPQEVNNGKMNRKEAINIAKKMLVAGATHEKIKKVLPVSESELALLSLNLN